MADEDYKSNMLDLKIIMREEEDSGHRDTTTMIWV